MKSRASSPRFAMRCCRSWCAESSDQLPAPMLDWEQLKEAAAEGEIDDFFRKLDIADIPSFTAMPEGLVVRLLDDYFPESTLSREDGTLVVEITEHIYTKYWQHKWHGRVYADAMLRAIKRFIAEGHPFREGEIKNDDEPHIFIRWKIHLPVETTGQEVIAAIDSAFELVGSRADLILENAETVLVLGKDTGDALERLRRIASRLESPGD